MLDELLIFLKRSEKIDPLLKRTDEFISLAKRINFDNYFFDDRIFVILVI